MQRTFFLYLASTALAIGCGGSTPGTSTGDTVDVNFQKLTFSAGYGWGSPQSMASTCGSANVVTVDGSGSYTNDSCKYSPQGLGERTILQTTLDAAQMQEVRAALRELQIGQSGLCGADKGTESMVVEYDDGTEKKYLDDFYSCQPATDGFVYVKNIDNVGSVLFSLSPPATFDTLPFDELEVTSTGGMPTLNAGATCTTSYVNTFILDVPTKTLSWDYCNDAVFKGQRSLSQVELESVATQLAKNWSFSVATSCIEDIPSIAATITREGVKKDFRDAETACGTTLPAGQLYVQDLGALVSLLQGLTQAS